MYEQLAKAYARIASLVAEKKALEEALATERQRNQELLQANEQLQTQLQEAINHRSEVDQAFEELLRQRGITLDRVSRGVEDDNRQNSTQSSATNPPATPTDQSSSNAKPQKSQQQAGVRSELETQPGGQTPAPTGAKLVAVKQENEQHPPTQPAGDSSSEPQLGVVAIQPGQPIHPVFTTPPIVPIAAIPAIGAAVPAMSHLQPMQPAKSVSASVPSSPGLPPSDDSSGLDASKKRAHPDSAPQPPNKRKKLTQPSNQVPARSHRYGLTLPVKHHLSLSSYTGSPSNIVAAGLKILPKCIWIDGEAFQSPDNFVAMEDKGLKIAVKDGKTIYQFGIPYLCISNIEEKTPTVRYSTFIYDTLVLMSFTIHSIFLSM